MSFSVINSALAFAALSAMVIDVIARPHCTIALLILGQQHPTRGPVAMAGYRHVALAEEQQLLDFLFFEQDDFPDEGEHFHHLPPL